MACGSCGTIQQAPLPSRPIERGRPGPGLLAHVLVSKYADHLPLYRQSGIYERDGIDLDRSTLAGWVGKSTALLEPLADVIGRHVLAGQAIFADDTPLKMQAKVKCKTTRIWTYVRDERPWDSRGDSRGDRPQSKVDSRDSGGLGIGLAFVKELAETHGGVVEGEAGDDGTCFRFTLFLQIL